MTTEKASAACKLSLSERYSTKCDMAVWDSCVLQVFSAVRPLSVAQWQALLLGCPEFSFMPPR